MENNMKEQKIEIEYWPHTPIIVNGIVASNFYRANLAIHNTLNQR